MEGIKYSLYRNVIPEVRTRWELIRIASTFL